jgi:hypothetical protein
VEKRLEYLVTAFPGVLRTGRASRGPVRVMRRRSDSILLTVNIQKDDYRQNVFTVSGQDE